MDLSLILSKRSPQNSERYKSVPFLILWTSFNLLAGTLPQDRSSFAGNGNIVFDKARGYGWCQSQVFQCKFIFGSATIRRMRLLNWLLRQKQIDRDQTHKRKKKKSSSISHFALIRSRYCLSSVKILPVFSTSFLLFHQICFKRDFVLVVVCPSNSKLLWYFGVLIALLQYFCCF